MKRGGTGAKTKGNAFEREIAALIGGGVKRQILSGAAGGNDLFIPTDHIWDVWGLECKRRANLPAIVDVALRQAEVAIPTGSPRRPGAVMRADHGRPIFTAYLSDVDSWARALAELGQGQKVKALLREIDRATAEIRKLA